MSKKSEKKNRHQKNSDNDIVDENMTYVSQDKMLDYLRNIMRRFSGYNFISVSKSIKSHINEEGYFVEIVVHKSIPIQSDDGKYRSDKDQYIRQLFVKDGEFPGMIMDRQKQYAFGNPFKRPEDEANIGKVPNLGEDKVSFKQEDESIQPL